MSIERAATVAGTYAVIANTALVNTQVLYPYWDPTGDATHWYRWRIASDTGAPPANASPYSTPFQGTSPAATVVQPSYATLEDVLGLFETRPTQANRLVRMAKLLGTVAQEINREAGRDFYRHPAGSGTETRYVNGPRLGARARRICVHEGILSLTGVDVRLTQFQDYETVDPSDYQLESLVPELGRPYDHIALTGVLRWRHFPSGPSALKVTGAFGWSAPPLPLIEGNAERVRQIAFADGDYSGSREGEDAYGSPSPFARLPDVVYRFLQSEKTRYFCET